MLCVCVCACRSAYFLRPHMCTVRPFLALCLGVLMGRFLPLEATTFVLRRTSTPDEEVEEEEDEQQEELLPFLEDAELSVPQDESTSVGDTDSVEFASSSGFDSPSELPKEASEKDAPSLVGALATIKLILAF